MSLNTSLIYKRLVIFLKLSLKMKWLDFVVAVIFDAPFSSVNCDLGNRYDDKVMIFGDNIYFL